MADRYELAFIKNALNVTSTDPQEQTALINLLFQRLLTGNFQISSAGVVTFQFNGLFADGLVGTPSIAFTNEPTTGRYRIGAGNVGESLLGGLVFDWSATRLQMGTIHLTWAFDNTKDIGASGASRPRDLFLGRNASVGGTLVVTSTSAFTGAVTLTGGLNTPLAVAQGGTALAAGTSGGVLGYTANGTLASSAALTQHGVVLGGGAGATPTSTSAGTTAQVLTSNGAAADPTFQALPIADVFNDFRLTLTTATSVTTSDVTAATTVYLTPHTGRRCTVFDGSGNATTLTSAEISIAVPATTSQMYDVFVFSNSGTLTLELLAWTNDTTRATAIVKTGGVDAAGVYTKSGDTTRRYVGSVRTTTVSGQTEDSVSKRYLWNYYNRGARQLQRIETAGWNYTTATVRQANGSASNQVVAIIGVADVLAKLTVSTNVSGAATAAVAQIGIGLNVTNAFSSGNVGGVCEPGVGGTTVAMSVTASYNAYPAVGLSTFAWCEWATTSGGTNTWNSLTAGSNVQGGITGWIEG